MSSAVSHPSDDSPMMRQWAAIKADHEDCVVLFRLGDFYEAFYGDAGTVASVCDVTLTSRPVKKSVRAPMAGVPFHAADTYIARLVRAGHRVAIVEQLGNASPKRAGMSPPAGAALRPSADGIIARDVVRIVTSGTLLDEGVLDPRANNHLAAVAWVGDRVGLAHADLSTGEFATTDMRADGDELPDELARVGVAEMLVSENDEQRGNALAAGLQGGRIPVVTVAAHRAMSAGARRALLEYFGVATLAAYGCEDRQAALTAAGMVAAYLAETQKDAAGRLRGLLTYDVTGFMHLDVDTRRNLELLTTLHGEAGPGTLVHVLDQTVTAMGARLLRRRLEGPLVDRERIGQRLDEVAYLLEEEALREEIRTGLRGVPDLERLTARVTSGYAGPRELLRLADGLLAAGRLARIVGAARGAPAGMRDLFAESAVHGSAIAEQIHAVIDPEAPAVLGTPGVIRRSHSAELDAIHDGSAASRAWIAGLETAERTRTGIKTLRVGFNKVFGYYLEVPKSATAAVPGEYIRRQTVATGERYVTPDLKAREEEVLSAEERVIALERSLYRELLEVVAAGARGLVATAVDIGRLDVAASLAEVARRRNYVRPTLDESRALLIEGGRHPVVEALAGEGSFVPTDLRLDEGEIVLLTGPNMAGKSTVLRQVALMCLLAQAGSFVPATRARLGIVDRIFSRIGARDELALGASTFMVEMVETARILNHATPRSLVVLDELGRGTSTYDGMAIAWAVVEAIHDQPRLGCRTLFATHYHELTSLEDRLARLRNAHMVVAETQGRIAFLHQVADGPADRSYGIHVAQLAGIPPDVTTRAWEILEKLERDGNAPWQDAGLRPPQAGGQMALFGPLRDSHPVLDALRALELERLTPLEALNVLAQLARSANDGN